VNKDLQVMTDNKQQILSRLKPMVGNNRQWEAFNNYLDILIEQQQKALEQETNSIMLNRAQGAIAVLRKLKYLRDEVND
jgi:predicted N-acyltransferase